jgi:hypothetical protein
MNGDVKARLRIRTKLFRCRRTDACGRIERRLARLHKFSCDPFVRNNPNHSLASRALADFVRCPVDTNSDTQDHDIQPIGRIKFEVPGDSKSAPEVGPLLTNGFDEAERHVLTPPSLLMIGGLAATSGPVSAGVGCARYPRQQARDREDARLRE